MEEYATNLRNSYQGIFKLQQAGKLLHGDTKITQIISNFTPYNYRQKHSCSSASDCPTLMALDSKVAFQQRALQIDFTTEEVDALELAGVDTFAKYAFCSQYQPGQQDEKPLVAFLEAALGEAPNDLAKFRRLFFESHALCLQDLRQKVERTEHSETKVLPLAEKVERVNQLKSRLPGLLITQQLEPSHQLIDKAVQQWEENSLRYIELTACNSREQEVLAEKSTPSITFDSTGNIKITKKQEIAQCSLTGDLRLRTAMQRRALAYDMAGVASFLILEKWSNLLFEKLQQEPPHGYRYVNHDQLLRADKALWLRVAEETRAQVQGNGLRKPVDDAIEKWSLHPEIQYHIMPMPSSAPSTAAPKPQPNAAGASPKSVIKDFEAKTAKGKGKGKQKGKITIPENCEIKFGDPPKPICMKYNIGTCRGNVKPGKRCQYGFHVCWKKQCHKSHSAVECTTI